MNLETAANLGEALSGLAIMATLLFGQLTHVDAFVVTQLRGARAYALALATRGFFRTLGIALAAM